CRDERARVDDVDELDGVGGDVARFRTVGRVEPSQAEMRRVAFARDDTREQSGTCLLPELERAGAGRIVGAGAVVARLSVVQHWRNRLHAHVDHRVADDAKLTWTKAD